MNIKPLKIPLQVKLLRSLYTFAYTLFLPIILIRLLWRSRTNPDYRQRWQERLGFIPYVNNPKGSIWIHAVSVGESLAAVPLVKALSQRYPDYQFIMTTTTPTGAAQVKKQLNGIVMHCFTPYDIPNILSRFLSRGKIHFCIVMETEIWPNLLRCCHQQHIPIFLANARLSKYSLAKYQKIQGLAKAMLDHFHMVAAQATLDGENFKSLGLDPERLIITGNIKFDLQLPDNLFQISKQLRESWGEQRPVIIAASTHEGEEITVLNAFTNLLKQYADALLVLVPRHPERFEKVKQLCDAHALSVVTRSSGDAVTKHTQVLLGDTMGELRFFYAASDVAFVGGSLVPIGGHNFIEPAAIGVPILSGPYLHNFAEISEQLKKTGGLEIAHDENSLAEKLSLLLANHSLQKKMQQAAFQVVKNNRGAVTRHIAWIEKNL